jgi:hypothetical protein
METILAPVSPEVHCPAEPELAGQLIWTLRLPGAPHAAEAPVNDRFALVLFAWQPGSLKNLSIVPQPFPPPQEDASAPQEITSADQAPHLPKREEYTRKPPRDFPAPDDF